jgi:hypothetical protein
LGENVRFAFRVVLIAAIFSFSSTALRAEEDGSGHYFPGGLSSSIDLLPDASSYHFPQSAFAIYNASLFYHGAGGVKSPFGPTDSNATTYANSSVFLYRSKPIQQLGNIYYGAALSVPYVWLKVNGTLLSTKTRFHDTDNGFGDVDIIPLMIGWSDYPKWKLQGQFGIYAPTGNYEKFNAANIGRNYWTFEPSAALEHYYGDPNSGLLFDSSIGFDFSTKNGAIRYQSGDVFHYDGTLSEVIAINKEYRDYVGIGVSGFFYQQFTADGGSGAILSGSNETMTTGLGPALSYSHFGKLPCFEDQNFAFGVEAKWLPELAVDNRLSGNIVWLKFAFAWGSAAGPPSARGFLPQAPGLRINQPEYPFLAL